MYFENLRKFGEKKRKTLVSNLESLNVWTLLVRWAFLHKVTISIILVSSSFIGYFYIQKEYLERQLLEEQIKNLKQSLKNDEEERKMLKAKIKALENKKKANKQASKKLKADLEQKDDIELREILIDLTSKLIEKRGLK